MFAEVLLSKQSETSLKIIVSSHWFPENPSGCEVNEVDRFFEAGLQMQSRAMLTAKGWTGSDQQTVSHRRTAKLSFSHRTIFFTILSEKIVGL